MSSYLAISRGASGLVPPISLAFWRWVFAFLVLLPFVLYKINKNREQVFKEWKKLLFLGFTGFCLCGIFPAISGTTTTVTNMGIIYSASPVFIILFSFFLFKEKITSYQIVATVVCLLGVLIVPGLYIMIEKTGSKKKELTEGKENTESNLSSHE
jgi:drug/metabolite transporter (DMT)-like permease